MSGIRTFLHDRKGFIGLLLVLTLALRVLVPSGYMASNSSHGITIELCSGVPGKTVWLALPGVPEPDHGEKNGASMPCAFSGAGFDTASTADPIILALAIAFVIATGWRIATPPALSRRIRLRPPHRGPPTTA